MSVQTPMIMDGLRRCSDTAENQDRRPGRNFVAFLLICNLTIYFWETLEVMNITYQSEQVFICGARWVVHYVCFVVCHQSFAA